MQNAMRLLDKLTKEAPLQSAQFESIFDQFLTLDKYEVEVPPLMRQRGQEIPEKWQEYLEVLKMADKMISFEKVY